jgi:hypothetical protein
MYTHELAAPSPRGGANVFNTFHGQYMTYRQSRLKEARDVCDGGQ